MAPTCLRPLLRFRSFAILFLTPLLLLPLPLVVSTREARCAYIIIIMAVYWCTEVIPLAVTALIPVVFFPLLGVQTAKKVCFQYLNNTNMLFLGGLIVAISVEQWNLHKRIALRVLLILGVKPALLMLGFMVVTAFLSMWISNTATTAMMVPIVQAVLDQMDSTEYDVTMMEQATGQTNAVIELEEKSTSESTAVHVISNEQVPDDPRSSEEQKIKKRICKGMTLCVCYAASIGGTATLTGTGPNVVLKGQMNQLYPNNNDIVNFASWFGFAFPNMIVMLALAWLWLQCSFMGLNLKKNWGYGTERTAKEKAAYNVLKEEMRKLGPVSYAELNVFLLFLLLVLLWFTRNPGFVKGWAARLFSGGDKYITDSVPAMFVALLLFVLPAHKPKLIAWNQSMSDPKKTEEDIKKPFLSTSLLEWDVVQRKMPWSIVLLLGGGFALADASANSGLSAWLGHQMTPLGSIPPWAIATVVSLIIAVFTECTSNVATATLFLPVFSSLATSIKIHPLYVMVPATLSASFAFMLPVATPPNAIVFSYGHLRVLDMVRTGIVMNLIGVCCITLAINTWGRPVFGLDTFPAWANSTADQ
ncbi:solute carrier family 13 member 5 isoform X1 [Cyanistes caeruleus]|uniref:Solute carrier family 13 member 5 n=2 Tax=Cyanistes caeruleus TaxID=156563 RepID=A0A8C0VGM7_CYACU|nr:solute carrier family 13 member 5 isoform X1 [Cyanistes caeruleus]XP_023795219.1 solute carrier family 13 member 5 isoform X1 [Cyanistes caeruleus]XP_023795220.1 solute carrier family 13 member 5 isoform X1 [Cyanistes caeruleus]XP_023795221.1 solute carrier family 13 member 5 isoform X1 [Cyanistes caeruleus]XP_023795222.1 solute carrier family 13 member 5 isoform X1 [Cyanistes caeruleus]XP_023795224.1 solute carrier family 13 member 5 isoform X1 [Cyanistes caeruleus]XP_023795225.1 solute c